MKNTILLILIFLIVGCANSKFDVGLAVHANQFDKPEYDGGNPLGVMRYSYSNRDQTLFCEHISSLPDIEKGMGLNLCGIGLRIY